MTDALITAFSGPGGVFMYAITALGAFALAVLLDRLLALVVRGRVDVDAVRAHLGRGELAAAVQSCGAAPLGRVLAAGAAQGHPEAAWEAMGAAAVAQERGLRQRVGYLGAVANLCTMLGLLGTVYGLILAFDALSDASAAEKAVRLSQGIATAMATTAWGLLVGIPALGAHAWLEDLVARRLAEIEECAGLVALALRRPPSDG